MMKSAPSVGFANNGRTNKIPTDQLEALRRRDSSNANRQDRSPKDDENIHQSLKKAQGLSSSMDQESIGSFGFSSLNVGSVFGSSAASNETAGDSSKNAMHKASDNQNSSNGMAEKDVGMKEREDSNDTGPPVLERMVLCASSPNGKNVYDDESRSSVSLDRQLQSEESDKNDTCEESLQSAPCAKDNMSDSETNRSDGPETGTKSKDCVSDMEVDQDLSKSAPKESLLSSPSSPSSSLHPSENVSQDGSAPKKLAEESSDMIVAEMDTDNSQSSALPCRNDNSCAGESKDSASTKDDAASQKENGSSDKMIVKCVSAENSESSGEKSDTQNDAKGPSSERNDTGFNMLNIKIKTEKPDFDYEGTGSRSASDKASAQQENKQKNTTDKDKSDSNTANSDVTNEEENQRRDAEMKGYITDTMNELLGLFGYDKVDENLKDKLDVDKATKSAKQDSATDKPSSQKPESSSSSNKKDQSQTRFCSECRVTKGLKYQVLFQGTTRFMCSDACFQSFRSKQKLAMSQQSVPGDKDSTGKESCGVCSKEIRNGQGFLPPISDSKPMCSEECMKKYQQIHEPKWECVECKTNIQSRSKCLMWETMEFCSEECLGKYQSYLGSHCACCQAPVQRPSLGKYCVRFGLDIRQFCSGRCLEDFKKGLKVCTFCQKDLSNSPDGFVAPVGDKGKFKDFCSQQCMERYEVVNSTGGTPPMQKCSICRKMTPLKVKVNYEGKTHFLCSDPCVAAFRYTNKINTTICDTCHNFFKGDSKVLTLQFEGSSRRFCSKNCINLFVLSNRKIVPCSWCKVKKYNFDMIERVDSNNQVQLFCSLNCLSLFRVSLNASSSRTIRCDHCHQLAPAQYHLTMSDASIRNFCTYNCVMQFQSQFGTVPVLTTTGQTATANKTSTTVAQTPKPATPQVTSLTPVISSVMSLAPNQGQATPSTPVPVSQLSNASLTTKLNNLRQTIAPSPANVKTNLSSSQGSAVRDVVVKPPPPRLVKNKGIMCRPFTMSKAVSCKPLPCHKSTQTEGSELGAGCLLPIPVPMYVPVPMHMYNRPVPTPLPFPLPIPIPIFIPTSKGAAPEIFKHIKEIQEKIPDNPFEAELLMMAEMVAADTDTTAPEAEKSDEEKESVENPPPDVGMMLDETCHSRGGGSTSVRSFGEENSHDSFFPSDIIEPLVDLENVLEQQQQQQQPQPAPLPPSVEDPKPDIEDLVSPRELRHKPRSVKRSSRSSRESLRLRSRKRQKLDEDYYEDASSTDAHLGGGHPQAGFVDLVAKQQHPDVESVDLISPLCDANMCLKYTFGVNAWKHWVVEKNAQLEKGSQSSRKLKLFKTDLLQLTADELNYSLCLFVKEVRKPNGEEYAPDSIYYLCLGIQQYLFENGRIDNIFMDSYYEKFTECLNEVLQRQEMLIDADGCFITRIEEEILWESKQLGAHSPHVLLNTLMYFSTKYFMLKTVEDHLRLSFSHVVKHWRKNSSSSKTSAGPRNVLLRYYPPVTKDSHKKKEDQVVYEQSENLENPLRCPVKLYEFYLSKCPESVKGRNDVFYLYPERSCVPDSPVWYSTQPLGKETIAKMLQRIKMVREINEAHQRAMMTPAISIAAAVAAAGPPPPIPHPPPSLLPHQPPPMHLHIPEPPYPQ